MRRENTENDISISKQSNKKQREKATATGDRGGVMKVN